MLSGTEKKGSGSTSVYDYIYFYSGMNKEQGAKAGVVIVIHNKYLKNIRNWMAVNE